MSSDVLVRNVSKLPVRERPPAPGQPAELVDKHELVSAPIPAEWIIAGNPTARNKCVASSTDGTASTYIWECTAGRFNWYYGVDETIYLLQGSIKITDGAETHVLSAGDTFFFPNGTRYEWTVDSYVRKIAFMHVPRSRKLRVLLKVFHALRRPVRFLRRSRGGPELSGLAAVSTRQD